MKTKVPVLSLMLLLVVCAPRVVGGQFRTDINPALLYYQSFLLAPELDAADRDFLWNTNNWTEQKLPARFGRLMGRYDAQFELVRRAAPCTPPCDWGIDLVGAGPATFLPQLAREKAVAQTARLRVMWDLQQGKPGDASDDWLAAFTLARRISTDGTLISLLVQIASEAIEFQCLAENFGKFPPEMLKQLLNGLEAAPKGTTVAGSLTKERRYLPNWLLNEIGSLRKQYPGTDAKVMEGIESLLSPKDTGSGKPVGDPEAEKRWAEIKKAAGGKSEGVVRLLQERETGLDELAQVLALPYHEYKEKINAVTNAMDNSPNPFVRVTAPSLAKARAREFRIDVARAMVRAALEYKVNGMAGFQAVQDPCGRGPFTLERFRLNGTDRGFLLRSAYDYEGTGKPEVLIFVEKPGPAFRVNGPHAGEAYK